MIEREACGTDSRTRAADSARGEREIRVLVVPPYVGEFGWELMNWQARVRWVVERCTARRVIAFGDPGKRRLYEGPRVEHAALELGDMPGAASDDRRMDGKTRPMARARLRRAIWRRLRVELARMDLCGAADVAPPRDVALLSPGYAGRMWPTSDAQQSFVSLRDALAAGQMTTDVVLVPRIRQHAPERSHAIEWWNELENCLTARGLRVARAPMTLDAAIAVLSRCRLAAGGSTGGLHLASLCECPHYVWGDGDAQRWTDWGMSNRQRYETLWNPLGTPAHYDALGWRPSVQQAAEGIERALHRIGRDTDYERRLAAFRRVWSLRRRAASLWMGRHADLIPWRLRRWVAEKVL